MIHRWATETGAETVSGLAFTGDLEMTRTLVCVLVVSAFVLVAGGGCRRGEPTQAAPLPPAEAKKRIQAVQKGMLGEKVPSSSLPKK
jgi:hypothetical protein